MAWDGPRRRAGVLQGTRPPLLRRLCRSATGCRWPGSRSGGWRTRPRWSARPRFACCRPCWPTTLSAPSCSCPCSLPPSRMFPSSWPRWSRARPTGRVSLGFLLPHVAWPSACRPTARAAPVPSCSCRAPPPREPVRAARGPAGRGGHGGRCRRRCRGGGGGGR